MDSCLALRCLRRKLGIDALDVIGPMDREALKDKRATGKKETTQAPTSPAILADMEDL